MHPVAHAVEIPIERVERELAKAARDRLTGSLTIFFRLKPEGALAVWFSSEKHEVIRVGRTLTSPPGSEIFGNGQPTERELTVKQMLDKERYRFQLVTTVSKLIAHFDNGELKKLEPISGNDHL